MKRKILVLLLAFTMLLSACGGKTNDDGPTTVSTNLPEGPFGPYEETVTISVGQTIYPTLTFPEGQSPTDNKMLDDIRETLNVEVDFKWQVSDADTDDKINLAIASNDLPDAMVVNSSQLRALIKNDQIQDLTEIIEQYASTGAKGILSANDGEPLDYVTFDDKVMAIPQIATQDDGYTPLWIRQDWLDKLGLEAPKTIEDLYEVAQAFVELDPDGNGENDTIGLVGAQQGTTLFTSFLQPSNNCFNFDPVASALNAFPGYWVKGEDDKLVYGSTLPETRESLEVLADMYAKGLIDAELGTRADSSEPIVNGKVGMCFGQWWFGYWPLPSAFKNDPEANWVSYGVPLNKDGDWVLRGGNTMSRFLVVRKGYEHPELAMLLQNLVLREENSYTGEYGLPIGYFPVRLVLACLDEQPVHRKYLKEILYEGKNLTEDDITEDTEAYKLLLNDFETIKESKNEPYDDLHPKYWNLDAPNFPRHYSLMVGAAPFYENPPKEIVNSEIYQFVTLTMEKKWSNLDKMENEVFLSIILGTKDISAFDEFVEDWYTQGGEEITQEMNDEI